MSKNKRYTCNFKGIIDNQQNKRYGFKEEDIGIKKLCDLLNEQEQRIKELEEIITKEQT